AENEQAETQEPAVSSDAEPVIERRARKRRKTG
ncbi:MAG: hypothetical protein RI932_1941, partial [Pseudomonadota bacterium]